MFIFSKEEMALLLCIIQKSLGYTVQAWTYMLAKLLLLNMDADWKNVISTFQGNHAQPA